MGVCDCGRSTNDARSMCDRCGALLLFGLTHDATQTEIKDAYRTLAKVWHPDRFNSDEQLRHKAEEKLKEINSAYQLLTAPETAHSTRSRASSQEPDFQRSSAASSAGEPTPRGRARPVASSFRAKRNRKTWLIVFVGIPIVCGIAGYLEFGNPTLWERWKMAFTSGSATHPAATPASEGPHPQAGEKSVSNGQEGNSEQDRDGRARSAQKAAAHAPPRAATDRASLVVYPADDPQVPYFTVGSTKNDVIRVQGRPSRIAGNTFEYGKSKVYFQNGRVESWRIDSNSPLKARMPE